MTWILLSSQNINVSVSIILIGSPKVRSLENLKGDYQDNSVPQVPKGLGENQTILDNYQ